MVSYGFALLVVGIAVYVALQLTLFQPQLVPTSCTAFPGFSCTSYTIYKNGTLFLSIAQATGTTITVLGAACSTSANSTGNGPLYGNVNVLKYSAAMQFYPDNSLSGGLLAYTDNNFLIKVNCYTSSGTVSSLFGSVFNGYVWLNYTSSGLPSNTYSVTRVVQFSARYS